MELLAWGKHESHSGEDGVRLTPGSEAEPKGLQNPSFQY